MIFVAMVWGKRTRWSLIAWLFLAALGAYGLEPGRVITQYGHRVWLRQDGLLQNTVQAICQTHDGYLWLGTREGLARFDGSQFTSFNLPNIPALRMNGILSLLEDRDGALWVGTNGAGVLYYKDGRFTFLTAEMAPGPDNYVNVGALLQDHAGAVWIGTDAGLFRFQNGQIQVVNRALRVTAIAEDADQHIWIGTSGNGLMLWQNERMIPIRGKLSSDYVRTLLAEGDSLWVGSNDGLRLFKDGKFSLYSTQDGLARESVSTLYKDREGNRWIGTEHAGVRRISPEGQISSYRYADGLSSNDVMAILEDGEGNLWIGTVGNGLNQLRDAPFDTLSTREGLSSGYVRAIVEDHDGDMWIATQTGGLNRLHRGKVTVYGPAQGLSSNLTRALFVDGDNSLWVGTEGQGLNHLTRDGKVTVLTRAQGLVNDMVRVIMRDREGNLWIGTSGGLSRYRDGKFVNFGAADGLAGSVVWEIRQGRDGGLWIATNGGVSRFKDGKFTNITKRDGLSSSIVRALYEDHDGVLWIGTRDNGINRLKAGKVFAFPKSAALPADSILSINEDGGENLWLGTNRGVVRVQRQALNAFAEGRSSIVNSSLYDAADGMRSEECVTAVQPVVAQAHDGRLWFSTANGAAILDPRRVRAELTAHEAILDQILVDRKRIAILPALELPPGQGDLEFHYTAIAFAAPEKIRFKYKLEGFDEDWVDAGTRRVAYYTNIPPGRYRFRVMVQGAASERLEAVSVPLRLLPHFYQSFFFWAAIGLLSFMAAISIYWLHWKQLGSQKQMLLARVAECNLQLQREKAAHERTQRDLESANRTAEVARQIIGSEQAAGALWRPAEPGIPANGANAGSLKPENGSSEGTEVMPGRPSAPAKAAAAPPAKEVQDGGNPAQGLRVLVAEDNAINQKLAVALLGKLGHHVELAGNGREAWEKWKAGDYDLILMDVQMPEVDGFEATRRIRAGEDQSGRHIPIIAMTAHAMNGDRESCLAAGMDDYISKPMGRASLCEAISRNAVKRTANFNLSGTLSERRGAHQACSE